MMVKYKYAQRSMQGYKKCCEKEVCVGRALTKILEKSIGRQKGWSTQITDWKKTPKKKIKSRSTKRAKEESLYLKENKAFLETHREIGTKCPVFPDKPITEVHHMKGRIGKLLLDKEFWLPVSSRGHAYIEKHREEAMQKGWSISRLKKV